MSCGESEPATVSPSPQTSVTAQQETDYYGFTESQVKRMFSQCSICHGKNGDASRGGAKLLKDTELTFKERVEIITNGKGTMTPYKGRLEESEIKALAKYIETFRD